MVYLVLGKVFISLWHNLYAFGQNFHCCTKWPNIENTIWSLWPQRTFAMQREEAIFSLLRRHSTLAIKRDGTFNDQRIFDRRSTNLQIHTFVRVRDFSNFTHSKVSALACPSIRWRESGCGVRTKNCWNFWGKCCKTIFYFSSWLRCVQFCATSETAIHKF